MPHNAVSLVLIIIISLLTQILTVMKSSTIAGTFGLSVEMDAYQFANSISSFIFGLVAGGIPTIIIPSYVKKDSRYKTDSFITLIYGMMAVMILIVFALRYQIVGLFSNRDELFVNTACNVLMVILLSQYAFSVTNITAAYFQCKNKYSIPKVINLFAQIAVVIYLIINHNINIYQYAYLIASGVAINFILDLLMALKNGWRYRLSFKFDDPDVIQMVKLFFPILFSSSVFKLSLFIDSTIASRLDTGKLTVLSYSNQIASIVNSIFISNLILYAYPKIISRIKEEGNQVKFWNQVHVFHSIVCLLVAGFISVGREGIALLFEQGSFTGEAVNMVYIGAAIYVCGQQFNIVRDQIYRYFYAKGDTKTASINSVIVSAVNISMSLLLIWLIGFYGIIIGTVVASAISLVIVMVRFSHKFTFDVAVKQLVMQYVKNIGISFVTILIVLLTKKVIDVDAVMNIILFGLETIAIYLILTLLLNRTVLRELKNI